MKVFFVDAQYQLPTPLDHDIWNAIHTSEKKNPSYFLKSHLKVQDKITSPGKSKKRKMNSFRMMPSTPLSTSGALALNQDLSIQPIHSTIDSATYIPAYNSQMGLVQQYNSFPVGSQGIPYPSYPYQYSPSPQLPLSNFSHMNPTQTFGFPAAENKLPSMRQTINRPLSLPEIEARILHPSILHIVQRKRQRNRLSLETTSVTSKEDHTCIMKHSTSDRCNLKSDGIGSTIEDECIDLCIGNDVFIPIKKLLEMQKWEEGYPSKIAKTAVEIKVEKNTPTNTVGHAHSNAETNDISGSQNMPITHHEQVMIRQLQECGFENRGEILAALRHTKSSNANLGFDQIIENAMIYIIGQREEAEEARKMDIARMESEFTILQEREQQKDSQSSYDYSVTDILGKEGDTWTNSVAFPHSDLLKCSNIRSFFRCLLDLDDVKRKSRTRVSELLSLELKARKWYGEKLPVAYFQFGLRDRLLSDWMNKKVQSTFTFDERDKAVESLDKETNALKEAMFCLENQVPGDLGVNVPKLFVDARKSAITNGLISDLICGSGMIFIE